MSVILDGLSILLGNWLAVVITRRLMQARHGWREWLIVAGWDEVLMLWRLFHGERKGAEGAALGATLTILVALWVFTRPRRRRVAKLIGAKARALLERLVESMPKARPLAA